MTTDVKEALAFTPPPREKVEQSLGLLRRYFAPETIGIENIQVGRPTLFVGNHTRFGVIDLSAGAIPWGNLLTPTDR